MEGNTKQKRCGGWKQASLTVEAACVVPAVLFLICMILTFGFYTHQKVWYTAAAWEAALTPGGERQKAEGMIGENPLGLDRPGCTAEAGEEWTRITYSGTGLTLWGKYRMTYQADVEKDNLNPVTHIRNIRMAAEIAGDLRGE